MPLNGTTLGFCGGGGSGSSSCCGAADDAALRKRFEAMNVSDAACAGVVKSVLCAVRTDRYYLCLSIYHEFPWPSRLQGEKNLKTKKKKSTSVGSAVSAVWVAYQVFDVLPDQADIPGGGSKLSTFFFHSRG